MLVIVAVYCKQTGLWNMLCFVLVPADSITVVCFPNQSLKPGLVAPPLLMGTPHYPLLPRLRNDNNNTSTDIKSNRDNRSRSNSDDASARFKGSGAKYFAL